MLAVLICMMLSGPQLVRHVSWKAYAGFATEVTRGRAEPADMELLAPILNRRGPEHCDMLDQIPLVTLNFYAHDLIARQAGLNPFLPASDPALNAQRQATRAVVEDALACAPLDGNLWLSLAILSRAMGDDPEKTAQHLALSERYAPHEGWIAGRRAQLF